MAKRQGWIPFVLGIAVLAWSALASADEPRFCDPATFLNHKINVQNAFPARTLASLEKLHVFQIGSLKIAGLAVGHSETSAVQEMAQLLGQSDERQKYCTWYLNDGDRKKTKIFNWHYLSYPYGDPSDEIATYVPAMKAMIEDNGVNFIDCAENQNFIALGCDGMAHRGPSAFAMFLSYLGCTPEHSVEIAVTLWGKNGIKNSMRLTLAAEAKKMGQQNSAVRDKFLRLMNAL